jgi:hypothetical protein
MESVKYLYTTGFFLSSQEPTCNLMADYCLNSNTALCFNLASESLFETEASTAKMLEMIEVSDFIFCNK